MPRRRPSVYCRHSGSEARLHQEEFVDFLDRVEDFLFLDSRRIGEGYRAHEPLADIRRERVINQREELPRLNRKLCSKGFGLCLQLLVKLSLMDKQFVEQRLLLRV